MASGFRPIEQVLGRSAGSILQWPSWSDFVEASVASDQQTVDRIIERLSSKRFCLVEAPQAHRKTVTAKIIGFTLANQGWATWYAEADNLDVRSAATQMSELDQAGILFIIDDAHKATEELEALVPAIGNLTAAACLILTRPTPHARESSGLSMMELARSAGLVETLTVNPGLVSSMASAELRKRGLGPAASSLIGQSDVTDLMALGGNDLEVINWLLKAWTPESGQPLKAVLREDRLLDFIVLRRLQSSRSRDTLLPLAALSRFEIPAQVTFLPDLDPFLANGTALFAPSPLAGRGLFARLSHPSLAQLYLRAGLKHGFLDGLSIDEYTVAQLDRYLSRTPINYRGVFRSLDIASRFDLADALLARDTVHLSLQKIVGASDTPFVSCLGLVGYVARTSVSFAERLLAAFLSSHSEDSMMTDLCAQTPQQLAWVAHWLKPLPREGSLNRVATFSPQRVGQHIGKLSMSSLVRVFRLLRRHFAWTPAMLGEALGGIAAKDLVDRASDCDDKDLKMILGNLGAKQAVEVCLLGAATGVEGLRSRIVWLLGRLVDTRQTDALRGMLTDSRVVIGLNSAKLNKITALVVRLQRRAPQMVDEVLGKVDWRQVLNAAERGDAGRVARAIRVVERVKWQVAVAEAITPTAMSALLEGASPASVRGLRDQLKVHKAALQLFDEAVRKLGISVVAPQRRERPERTPLPDPRFVAPRVDSPVAKIGDLFPQLREQEMAPVDEDASIDRLVDLLFRSRTESS